MSVLLIKMNKMQSYEYWHVNVIFIFTCQSRDQSFIQQCSATQYVFESLICSMKRSIITHSMFVLYVHTCTNQQTCPLSPVGYWIGQGMHQWHANGLEAANQPN